MFAQCRFPFAVVQQVTVGAGMPGSRGWPVPLSSVGGEVE
jgi:hypothetical protein